MGFSGILPGLVVFLTLCKLEAMAAMAPRQSSMIYLKNGGFPARKLLVYQRGPVFFSWDDLRNGDDFTGICKLIL